MALRRSCQPFRRKRIWSGVILGCILISTNVLLLAQTEYDEMPDVQGMDAGGKWTEYRSEDRMTAAKRFRFELPAERVDGSDDRAKIVLFCSDGKLSLADFRPNIKLSGPNWPGFWGRPQMHVLVRIDDSHSTHNWNWVNGHFLAMDKGTARELIGANLFRVEFQTPQGPEIAEFAPLGLELSRVQNACGLKPKKP
jgi:hypothetical protein